MEGLIDTLKRHDTLSLCRMIHMGLVRTSMRDFCQDANHMTALHLAVLHRSLPCVKVLLALGSNPLLRDSFGNSSVEIALQIRDSFKDPVSIAIAAQLRMSIKSLVPKPVKLPKVQLIDSNLRLFAQTTLTRRALIVSVQKFAMQELLNAATDAQLVGSSLSSAGFEVSVSLNNTTSEIQICLDAFVKSTPPDSLSVIFIACLLDQSKLLGSDVKFSAAARTDGKDVKTLLAELDEVTGLVRNTSFVVALDSARPMLTLRSRRALSESRLMTPLDPSLISQNFRQQISRSRSISRDFPYRDLNKNVTASSGRWVPPDPWTLVPGFACPPQPKSSKVAVLLSHTPGHQLPEELFDPLCLAGLGGEGSLLEPLNEDLGMSKISWFNNSLVSTGSSFGRSVSDLDHSGRSVTLDVATALSDSAPPPSLFAITLARELSKRPSSLATNAGPVTVTEILENTVKVVLMRSRRTQKPWTRVGKDVGGLVLSV